jgi:RNA polymerase sigma-54 factor
LVVRLARGNLPELRIKKEYVDMLKASRNGAQVHEFLRKQVHGASSLIEAVKFRRSRLMDVSRAIVEHQSEFFDVGPAGLKVLRMSDVGMQLGCDPSTISRTVADKYVQTPRGIYPMRYFFTGGTDTGRGAGASWDSIRMRVAELVKDEDLKNPFNDDQLAALLAKENIHISRRTVAKYRAQLEIPAARQRRRF